MDDKEKALHQILTECVRPFPMAHENKQRVEQRDYRLADIQRIAEKIVQQIALDKMS